jgi:ATP-dependent exoDNAse (exonuclease V) alpha subunit
MQLNNGQQLAIREARLGKNLFITGSAGTGKSVIINELKEIMGDQSLFLAPTGIAALNIEGMTLHRVFWLPISVATEEDFYKLSRYSRDIFYGDAVKTIIIDEISMVRADMFITIDKKLQTLKKNNLPFGGLQVIVVGDFYQLAPVLTGNEAEPYFELYDSIYAPDTDVWDALNFKTIELTEIMRQGCPNTVRALNSIRKGVHSQPVLNWLNKQCEAAEEREDSITLCTTNADVEAINYEKYHKLDAEEHSYLAKVEGTFKESPVPSHLNLKKGARVLICANGEGYVNGNMGTIEELSSDRVVVIKDDGSIAMVTPFKWTQYKYIINRKEKKVDKMVEASFSQIPLKLGYAVTIHKAQGLTFDHCSLDLGSGTFSHGQAYVGLSRVRALQNMRLLRPVTMSDIILDPDVRDFAP